MRLEIDIAEHHYNNIMALDSVSLERVPYKGIIMYSINAIKHGKVLEQEPRKGHWIDNTDLGYHVSICSNCDWRGHGDTCLIYKPKYCPNCGAYMRGIEK